MKKSVKIVLVVSAVLAVVFVGAVITAVLLFPGDRIKTIIEKQASTAMEMPVTIGSIGLSFAGLPAVKVSAVSVGPAREGEPELYSIDSVRARIDIFALFRRNIEIVSVDIEKPAATLLTREDGSQNFVLKGESDFTLPTLPFAISMKSLTIDHGSVVIDNRAASTRIDVDDVFYRISVDLAGNFKSMTADGELVVGNIAFYSGEDKGSPLIDGLGLRFSHAVSGDPIAGNLTLTRGELLVGDMPVTVHAEVTGYTKTSFSVSTGKHDAAALLRLIPPALFPDKDKMTIGGAYEFSLTGTADTESGQPAVAFNGSLDIDSMSISYAGLPKTIDDIRCHITFTEMNLDIREIGARIGKSTFSLSGAVDNYLETPSFSVAAKGSVDLGEAAGAFPMESESSVSGNVAFDLNARGAPSKPEKSSVSGSLRLDGITASVPGTLRHPARLDGAVSVTPSRLSIDNLAMTTGKSDLAFHGALTDYMALMYPREGAKPAFRGQLSSTVLNLDDMLIMASGDSSADTGEQANMEELLRTLPIPPTLTIGAVIDLGTVSFGKLKADSVGGSIGVGNGVMRLDNLAVRAYQGALSGNTALAVTTDDITYTGAFRLDRLDAGTFLDSFFGTGGETFGGKLSASLSFNGAGLEKLAMLENLAAVGSFSMENGQIRNWEFTKKLGSTLQFLNFDTIGFDTIGASVRVADQRIATDNLNAKTEFGAFSLSGSTGFDTSLDYDIVFRLNGAAVNLAKKNNLGLVSELLEDDTGTPVLHLRAGGTLKSPSFAIDTSKAQERAKERIKKEAEKLLGDQGEKLKEQGRKLLNKIFK